MSRQRLRLGVLALAALVLAGPAVAPTAAVTSWPVTTSIHGQAALAGPSADEDPGFLTRRQKAQAAGLIDADGRVPGSQREGGRAWPHDDTGYRIQPRDLEFLGLTQQQVRWWRQYRAPLGTTPHQFKRMSASLFRVLCSSCERPQDYDVRLQGSWAFFFSGRHKDFPTERDLAAQPVAQAKAEARAKWDDLKSAGKLSDEDIRKGFIHQKYSFVNRTAVREAFPDLEKWSTVWEERLGRPIAPSLFPSSGPPDKSQEGNGVSTHFRNSDWVVTNPPKH